jgi:hypothetical protein
MGRAVQSDSFEFCACVGSLAPAGGKHEPRANPGAASHVCQARFSVTRTVNVFAEIGPETFVVWREPLPAVRGRL